MQITRYSSQGLYRADFRIVLDYSEICSTYIRSLFHPPLVDNEGKDLKGQALINALATAKLTLQFNLQSGDRFHNSGLVDNRKLFVKNGIALGEKYVLRLKLSGASVDESHLKGFVAFYDSGHHVLRHIGIVGKELLGVLWQTVATITEGWVVVVGANTRVKTNA